jgi:hypothetical protein
MDRASQGAGLVPAPFLSARFLNADFEIIGERNFQNARTDSTFPGYRFLYCLLTDSSYGAENFCG